MFFYLYVLKIYVGPYQTLRQRQRNQQALDNVDYTTQNIKEDSGVPFLAPVDVDQHSVGHYVAVNIEEWSNRPLTGEVKKIGELWLPFAGSMALITEHFEIPMLVVVRTDSHGHKKVTKVK